MIFQSFNAADAGWKFWQWGKRFGGLIGEWGG